MNQSRLEIKVGIFVFICLALLGVLLLQFSKGVTLFRKTYTIILNTGNVGGLKPRASVLMSGVMVGTVSKSELSPQGTNVSVYLKIFNTYEIHSDAQFKIEQSGFLGDQYIAIYPGENKGEALTDGASVHAKEPFNIQEVAAKVNEVIESVQHVVLNTNTLTNVALALRKLPAMADRAQMALDNVNNLIVSNTAAVNTAVSNLVAFSDKLNEVGVDADAILATNRPQINAAVSNLHAASVMVTNVMGDVQAGKGPVGELLKDQELAENISSIARNLSATSSNLALTTANLNRLGLWHFLWYHPKQEEGQYRFQPVPPNNPSPSK